MDSTQITGIIRHAMTFLGGLAVARGLVDAGTAEQIAGAVVTLIGVAWSIYAKRTPKV